MRVSTLTRILLDVALQLRNNGEPTSNSCGPQYICDLLVGSDHVAARRRDRYKARSYLRGLGMGGGLGVFGFTTRGEFSVDQQHERMGWLLFAAELAEELGSDFVKAVIAEYETPA